MDYGTKEYRLGSNSVEHGLYICIHPPAAEIGLSISSAVEGWFLYRAEAAEAEIPRL